MVFGIGSLFRKNMVFGIDSLVRKNMVFGIVVTLQEEYGIWNWFTF